MDLASGYYTNAALDIHAFPLTPILATYLPGNAAAMRGQFDLHATLKGPLKDPQRIEGIVEIPTLKVAYQALQFSNVGPIRAHCKNGVIELAGAEIKGNNTNIQLQGRIPVQGSAPLNVTLKGNADLKVLSVIDRQTDSAGQLILDLNARGNRANPTLAGKISLANVVFSTASTPLGVENVNGDIVIQNNRFEISKLNGQAGGGNISMRGYAIYQSGLQFHLMLDAETVRLRYPTGLRAVLNSQLALHGSSAAANLDGNVTVDRLSFTREFDLATFVSQFGTDVSAPPSEGIANNIQLDVGIQSSGDLGLESSKLSLQGQANLRVRGTAANPVIIGHTNVTDGELFFLNNRYHIDRANIDFANPVRTEPVINLAATTKVKQYNLSINMVGPMERLRTYYVSDPPLPPVDIINLVTRGTTTEAPAPANLGANSLIAQGLASQVSSRLEKLGGISNLQVDPLLGGSNRNPSARVAIQEHITKDVIFTYAADVTSTQNELIQIEYQVTPVWSLRLLRDERGNFSVEGRLHKSY
jgi:translocation and assembly module TamB